MAKINRDRYEFLDGLYKKGAKNIRDKAKSAGKMAKQIQRPRVHKPQAK